jgi:hypothetical protein
MFENIKINLVLIDLFMCVPDVQFLWWEAEIESQCGTGDLSQYPMHKYHFRL